MEKYIKKPVVVNAERFDIKKAEVDCFKYYPMVQDMYDLTSTELPPHRAGERFSLKDLHHSSVIHDGDYIVQGFNGQFFVIDKGTFELEYEEAE